VNICITLISLETTFSGLHFRRWQYGSICIPLAVVASQTREIARNSEKIRPYSSSRSSKVIDLGVNRKPICDFLLVINSLVTLAVSGTVFEILTLKGRKWLILSTPPLFEARARGNPLEFRDETYPRKTRGMGLLYGENCVILALTVFGWSTHVTDRQTDGIAMAYTRYSYAVARKIWNWLYLIYVTWPRLFQQRFVVLGWDGQHVHQIWSLYIRSPTTKIGLRKAVQM